MKTSVIYMSKTNHTKQMAENIARGMEKAGEVTARIFSIDEIDAQWVNESDCVVIGTPTYYADLSAEMKVFLESLGKYKLAGKLGGAFATAGFVYGGGDIAVSSVLRHMMFYGMMVYSSGCTENPPIHLGPVAVNESKETEAVFEEYGMRMAKQAKIFSERQKSRMDTIEALLNRRSCRKFEDRPVCEEDINTIVQCGLQAPSASNKQDTKIIIVKDPDKVKELSDLSSRLTGSKSDTFYGAKAVLIVVAPLESGYDVKYYQQNPMKNATLVMGNMLNAAYALGVGACWINSCEQVFESEQGKQILEQLGLKEYYGVGFCVLGYPKMKAGKKKIKDGRVFTL